MMLISKIGEFGLIERFRKSIKTDASVIKGSGDDCAVLAFDKDHYQLFTCDMIVEGQDFILKDNLRLIGRKALAISLSDIAACGGIPRYAVVSLALPSHTTVEAADNIAKGMFSLAKEYKVNIVGGDISKAACLIIDVAMTGIVEKKNLVLRSGAKIGDIVFVTGALGGSIRGKHLKFIPRVNEARYLVRNFKVNAMIDISDGLTQDLGHILESSKVGGLIYENLVPVSKESKNLEEALYAGEDFELLFTLPRKEARKIMKLKAVQFKPIGEIMDKRYGLKIISKNGREKKLIPSGFRHF